jgi:hypothetical protein
MHVEATTPEVAPADEDHDGSAASGATDAPSIDNSHYS